MDLREYLLNHKQMTSNIAEDIFKYVTQDALVEIEFEDKKTLFITIDGDTENLFSYFIDMSKDYGYIEDAAAYDDLDNVQECCFAAETKNQANSAVEYLKQIIPNIKIIR